MIKNVMNNIELKFSFSSYSPFKAYPCAGRERLILRRTPCAALLAGFLFLNAQSFDLNGSTIINEKKMTTYRIN
jgi:hypothetical protein